MLQTATSLFRSLRCGGSFWSLRLVDERAESLSVRRDVPQPASLSRDTGAMVTVYADGGAGYAAAIGVAEKMARSHYREEIASKLARVLHAPAAAKVEDAN